MGANLMALLSILVATDRDQQLLKCEGKIAKVFTASDELLHPNLYSALGKI